MMITIVFSMGLPANVEANGGCSGTFTVLHAVAENVNLPQGLNEPKIQQILNDNIGTPRDTITFDGIAQVHVGAGQFDYRYINQGVIFEGIYQTTWVGGTGDSGPINGGHMDVSPRYNPSKIRVHFVVPGTLIPTTVRSVGAFTTTPDRNANAMEFFDSSGNSLGTGYNQHPYYRPLTTIEFLGGTYGYGIAYVDIFSTTRPYEVDLLTFGGAPCSVNVDIDIKPGSDPNSINLGSKGNVPVAILGSSNFDAGDVDPSTVTLAGAAVKQKGKTGTYQASLEDTNGDGYIDLVVHIITQDLVLGASSTEAVLEGMTYGGMHITGSDSVNIVPS
jgi:hypothetical protein